MQISNFLVDIKGGLSEQWLWPMNPVNHRAPFPSPANYRVCDQDIETVMAAERKLLVRYVRNWWLQSKVGLTIGVGVVGVWPGLHFNFLFNTIVAPSLTWPEWNCQELCCPIPFVPLFAHRRAATGNEEERKGNHTHHGGAIHLNPLESKMSQIIHVFSKNINNNFCEFRF